MLKSQRLIIFLGNNMKQIFIYLGLTLILTSCHSHNSQIHPNATPQVTKPDTAQSTPPEQEDSYEYDPAHPVITVDEAVNIIISRLSQDDINYLKNSTQADRYMLHFGLGMGIRNSFGLWKGNEALLKNACNGKICHPDEASEVIISKLLERIKSSQ